MTDNQKLLRTCQETMAWARDLSNEMERQAEMQDQMADRETNPAIQRIHKLKAHQFRLNASRYRSCHAALAVYQIKLQNEEDE